MPPTKYFNIDLHNFKFKSAILIQTVNFIFSTKIVSTFQKKIFPAEF